MISHEYHVIYIVNKVKFIKVLKNKEKIKNKCLNECSTTTSGPNGACYSSLDPPRREESNEQIGRAHV